MALQLLVWTAYKKGSQRRENARYCVRFNFPCFYIRNKKKAESFQISGYNFPTIKALGYITGQALNPGDTISPQPNNSTLKDLSPRSSNCSAITSHIFYTTTPAIFQHQNHRAHYFAVGEKIAGCAAAAGIAQTPEASSFLAGHFQLSAFLLVPGSASPAPKLPL